MVDLAGNCTKEVLKEREKGRKRLKLIEHSLPTSLPSFHLENGETIPTYKIVNHYTKKGNSSTNNRYERLWNLTTVSINCKAYQSGMEGIIIKCSKIHFFLHFASRSWSFSQYSSMYFCFCDLLLLRDDTTRI